MSKDFVVHNDRIFLKTGEFEIQGWTWGAGFLAHYRGMHILSSNSVPKSVTVTLPAHVSDAESFDWAHEHFEVTVPKTWPWPSPDDSAEDKVKWWVGYILPLTKKLVGYIDTPDETKKELVRVKHALAQRNRDIKRARAQANRALAAQQKAEAALAASEADVKRLIGEQAALGVRLQEAYNQMRAAADVLKLKEVKS